MSQCMIQLHVHMITFHAIASTLFHYTHLNSVELYSAHTAHRSWAPKSIPIDQSGGSVSAMASLKTYMQSLYSVGSVLHHL